MNIKKIQWVAIYKKDYICNIKSSTQYYIHEILNHWLILKLKNIFINFNSLFKFIYENECWLQFNI